MNGAATAERLRRLRDSLARQLGPGGFVLTPFRQGVDCWVDALERPSEPPAVVRSAKTERLQTRYEGLVDFGTELEKQVVVSNLLRQHGVPTPKVIAWHRTADFRQEPSWMLMERVDHEHKSWIDDAVQQELGTLARRIHAIEVPPATLAAFPPSSSWGSWITNRILMRLAAAEKYVAIPHLPKLRKAVFALTEPRAAHARSLLHLDLRPPNLAVRDGRIVNVFDLGNAIVGDPWLELARIRGCGLLSSSFLRGYGGQLTDKPEFTMTLDAYELDLSALLIVVSREEFDDPALHTEMAHRTLNLSERVLEEASS